MTRRLMKYLGQVEGRDAYVTTLCTGSGSRRLIRDTGEILEGRRVFELADCYRGLTSECCDPSAVLPTTLYLTYRHVSGGCTFADEVVTELTYNGLGIWVGFFLGSGAAAVTLRCSSGQWRLDWFGYQLHASPHIFPAGSCTTALNLSATVTVSGAPCDGVTWAPPESATPYYQNSTYTLTISDELSQTYGGRGLIKRLGELASRDAYVSACCGINDEVADPDYRCCLFDAPTTMTATVTAFDPGLMGFVACFPPEMVGWTFTLTFLPTTCFIYPGTFIGCSTGMWYGTSYRTVCGVTFTISVIIQCRVTGTGESGLDGYMIYTGLGLPSPGLGTTLFNRGYGPRCQTPFFESVGLAFAFGVCPTAPGDTLFFYVTVT